MIGQSLLAGLRKLIRAAGFDVVRYEPRPPMHVEPWIAATIEAVAPYTMTSPQRIAALCEATAYVAKSGIPGDIVECGVWRGGSMMAVARTLLELRDATRHLYLFDTFEGMPPPSEEDRSLDGRPAADLLQTEDKSDPRSVWCVAPLEGVQAAMRSVGYDASRMHFVKGRVEDTIPEQAPQRIALLRLDTDWYESTRHELEHLFPRLSPGGVLIIDDYGHWQGARRAVDEYIERHRVPLLLHPIDYSARRAVKVG
ncbi:MAG TPA: TylF/MycF/NovP-related O-methyltransferase [Gammaproteobacteria bacterium]